MSLGGQGVIFHIPSYLIQTGQVLSLDMSLPIGQDQNPPKVLAQISWIMLVLLCSFIFDTFRCQPLSW